MNGLIEEKRQELEHICRRHHVRRIDLFEAATTSEFDPLRSDLDFLVIFQDLDIDQYADAYFGAYWKISKPCFSVQLISS